MHLRIVASRGRRGFAARVDLADVGEVRAGGGHPTGPPPRSSTTRTRGGFPRSPPPGAEPASRGQGQRSTTPACAVRVSRSPFDQPSASVTARSAIRPSPCTTSPASAEYGSGSASGSRRAPRAPRSSPADTRTAEESQGQSVNLSQPPPLREGEPAAQMAGSHKNARTRVQAMTVLGKPHRFECPRGDSPGKDMPAICGELVLGSLA